VGLAHPTIKNRFAASEHPSFPTGKKIIAKGEMVLSVKKNEEV